MLLQSGFNLYTEANVDGAPKVKFTDKCWHTVHDLL